MKKALILVLILGLITLSVVVGLNMFQNRITDTTNPATTTTEQPKTSEPVIEPKSVKITAVGDILLGRGVEYHLKIRNKSYSYPFREVKKYLKYGDVIFGNLEEPLTSRTKSLTSDEYGGKIILKNEPEAINGIKYAGFNLLNMANNHIMDFYEDGLYDTIKILKKEKIQFAGAGKNLSEARKLAIIEKNGVKVGLLSYSDMAYIYYAGNPMIQFAAQKNSPGVAPYEMKYILKDIKSAKTKVDILLISLHFGIEYNIVPSDWQVTDAHKIINAGADAIIGTHTHRNQGFEVYKGKPIFYSLGNFILDQNDPLNQRSFIINMEFEDKKMTNLTAIPIQVIEKHKIIRATGNTAAEMLNNEKKLCENLNTKCKLFNNTLKFDLSK